MITFHTLSHYTSTSASTKARSTTDSLISPFITTTPPLLQPYFHPPHHVAYPLSQTHQVAGQGLKGARLHLWLEQ